MRGYIASKMAFESGKKTWAERRSENRAESIEGNYVRSSLQRLDNDDVLLMLESRLQASEKVNFNNLNTLFKYFPPKFIVKFLL